MARVLKIYDDDKEIYSGNCSVNTAIFKGKIFGDFNEIGLENQGIRFKVKVSSGKDKNTDKWNKPTFVDCAAFGEICERIKSDYKAKDEIFIIAKYYQKEYEGRYYKGFIVKDVIQNKKSEDGYSNDLLENEYLPF